MSKAEKFIQDYTKSCSNELCAVQDRFGKKVISYHEWLTPDEARKALEIAREETIEELSDKAKVSSGLDGFYYGQGYKQAEKDMELSWEDLAIIDKLGDDFVKHNHTPMSDEEYYQEILKRFKERKEKLNGKDKEKH